MRKSRGINALGNDEKGREWRRLFASIKRAGLEPKITSSPELALKVVVIAGISFVFWVQTYADFLVGGIGWVDTGWVSCHCSHGEAGEPRTKIVRFQNRAWGHKQVISFIKRELKQFSPASS